MPSVAKNILSLPFARGLSQKEDPRWLEPGSMLTAQNAEHPKTNILQKRAGFTQLTTNAVGSGEVTATALQLGKRLGTIGGSLMQVASDQWTDAVWSYDDQGAKWVAVDRVPEVYVYPRRAVAAHDDVIREFDTCVCNGYEVHAYLSGANIPSQTNRTGKVWISIKNVATGDTVLSPTTVGAVLIATEEQAAPKLIAMGNVVVLGFVYGQSSQGSSGPPFMTSTNLALHCIDMTQPWLGVTTIGAPTVVTGLTLPPTLADLGAWDIAPTPGSSTVFGIAYQLAGSPNTIRLGLCSVSNASTAPAVINSFNLNSADSTYTGDGSPYLYAFGLEVTTSRAAVAYAYQTSGGNPTLRVNVQLQNWALVSTAATAINLLTQTGPGLINPLALLPPHTIAIATVNDTREQYRVAFSPKNSQWDNQVTEGTEPGHSSALSILYTVGPEFGAMVVLATVPGGSNVNQPRVTYGVSIASRWLPNVNGVGYIAGRLPSIEQGTYYLFADDAWDDLDTPNAGFGFPLRLVATFAPRLSNILYDTSSPQAPPKPYFLQDQTLPKSMPHICAAPTAESTTVYQTLISASPGSRAMAPTLMRWDMASPVAYQNCELGVGTGIATGCPSQTEGSHIHEFATPYYPSITSAGAGGGGNVGVGTYSYIATYEWTDAKGQLHRSGRSTAVEVVANVPSLVFISVTMLGFTGKEKKLPAGNIFGEGPQDLGIRGTQVTVKLWRTQANGGVYYELASTQNLSSAATWSIHDSTPDANIATNPLLYGDGLDGVVQGSILDCLTPPAFQAMCVHKNRYFGVDGTNVWATKELVDGEGPGFNELMAFSWADTDDPITAIASLDDKLVLFKRSNVAIVTGEGPEDNGGQNDWSPPQVIATDLGAIDWRSVVVKADGIFFMSDAGLRSLTRDMQVVPVPQVEDVLSANPSVTSALVHPSAGRVSMTTGDTRIDHNYVLECWTTAITTFGDGAITPVSAVVASVPVNGVLTPTYHWLQGNGTVWRESASSYLDSGQFQTMQVETAWVKAEGIEGFARFRRLQVVWQNADPHAFSVYVAYDYSSTYYLMGTVTAAQMTAMQTPLCQALFSLPRQRAESVRFKLVDAQDGVTAPVTGQGPVLISMGLEVSTYTNRRTNRLPGAQRM